MLSGFLSKHEWMFKVLNKACLKRYNIAKGEWVENMKTSRMILNMCILN